MLRVVCLTATAWLLLAADVPQLFHFAPPSSTPFVFPEGQNLPVLPELSQQGGSKPATAKPAPAKKSDPNKPLQPESRLELVRYVSGEFARALKPLPGGKKGFSLEAGKPLDEEQLRQSLANSGAAINRGDKVQITRMEFKDKQIVFDLNGGGRKRTSWRQRIHFEIGGVPTVTSRSSVPRADRQGMGSTIILDFGRPLPDMTPDELKGYLSGLLDFSSERSAAVHWIDTLPPEFQKAIKEKRAAVGMDREMVIAAMGRPGHKVRERNAQGEETEDWIYGQPPAKTTFVRFIGDKVVKVEEFN